MRRTSEITLPLCALLLSGCSGTLESVNALEVLIIVFMVLGILISFIPVDLTKNGRTGFTVVAIMVVAMYLGNLFSWYAERILNTLTP
jgi:hypothetical protein